jgi:hypothetical protein
MLHHQPIEGSGRVEKRAEAGEVVLQGRDETRFPIVSTLRSSKRPDTAATCTWQREFADIQDSPEGMAVGHPTHKKRLIEARQFGMKISPS